MYQFLIPDRAQGHSFASNRNFGSADKQLLMPFHCCGSLMESHQWDFQFGGADSDTMTSLEANDSTCGSGSNEFGVNSDQTLQNGFFTTGASDMNSSGMTSVEGGLQGLDLQDLVGQQHTCPPMHFSSNHLLVAARFFQQKRLRRALATSSGQMPSAGNSYADDTRSILSQGTPDNAKFSLPRSDWVFGTVNESQSVGSNGSKTSSPQQVSPDSSSPAIGSMPCIGCCPYGREQVEHHSLGLQQARTDFHNGMLDSFNCGSVQMKQVQDAMWPSHPQVPCGVLVPSCPNHSGGNQLLKSCEVGATKAKPRVRARRGQATDPHSIAERLRRERIADRFKSLQELVPNTNKTDRAIMLDEIIEYVKFLLTQVKLLNMSRLGSVGLILPIVSGLPEESRLQAPSEIPGDEPGTVPESMSAIEEYFARLISNNAGAALQFLQRKGLCLVPISLTDSTKLNTEAAGSQSHSLNLLN